MILKNKVVISLLIIAGACSPFKNVTINVLKPASMTFPAEVKSISIASLITDRNTNSGEIRNVSNIRLEPDFNYYSHYIDYLSGIQYALSESPRFERIIITELDSINYYTEKGEINWQNLIEICRKDTTDAVIILIDFILTDSLGIKEFLNSGCYILFKLTNNMRWIALYPSLLQTIKNDEMQKTFYWEETGYDCNEALVNLPGGDQILEESCYFTGYDLGKTLAPQWKESENRNYYLSGNNLIKTGSYYAGLGKWKEAEDYWLLAAKSPDKNQKSKATFNMALISEIGDDLDEALNWIEISDSLYSTTYSRIYKKKINDRLKERNLLDVQMGVTE